MGIDEKGRLYDRLRAVENSIQVLWANSGIQWTCPIEQNKKEEEERTRLARLGGVKNDFPPRTSCHPEAVPWGSLA